MKKKVERKSEDMREEYDFSKLKVVARGAGRVPGGGVAVQLEADVAKRFPNSKAVNDALRMIIEVADRTEAA